MSMRLILRSRLVGIVLIYWAGLAVACKGQHRLSTQVEEVLKLRAVACHDA